MDSISYSPPAAQPREPGLFLPALLGMHPFPECGRRAANPLTTCFMSGKANALFLVHKQEHHSSPHPDNIIR